MLCPNNNCTFLNLDSCHTMVNIFLEPRELKCIIFCRQISNQNRSCYLTHAVSQQQLHLPQPGLMPHYGQHFSGAKGAEVHHFLQADQQSEQVLLPDSCCVPTTTAPCSIWTHATLWSTFFWS